MSDAPTPDPSGPDVPGSGSRGKRGFTLDLSSPGGSARPKRPKGFVPVVQQTINLTTKRAEKPADPPAPVSTPETPPAPKNPAETRGRSTRRDDDRAGGRPGGGTTLADLLDEATLARLRGGP